MENRFREYGAGVTSIIFASIIALSQVPKKNQAVDKESLQASASIATEVQTVSESSPVQDNTPTLEEQTYQIEKGDTLLGLLSGMGVKNAEGMQAISELSKVYSPRGLKLGQDVKITTQQPSEGEVELVTFSIRADNGKYYVVTRQRDGRFIVDISSEDLISTLVRVNGTIKNSIFQDAIKSGIPPSIINDLIQNFSYNVDFQRQIKEGDSFDIAYEQIYDKQSGLQRTGNLVYGKLTISNRPMIIYRYQNSKGRSGYYNEKGSSVKQALLKTPISGARLSSRYGKRFHPIHGYTKMHKGVDFAAPIGSPIYSAGDGTVAYVGWNGGYGKYVKIRHSGGYDTAYAHLSRFAKIRPGMRLKQGQLIGFLGNTGLSTGPHLHFEVHYKGNHINPLKISKVPGEVIKGDDLKRFLRNKNEIDIRVASLPTAKEVAESS